MDIPGVMKFIRLLVLSFFFLVSLVYGEALRYEGSQWKLIETGKVRKAIAETTQSKYPDCDAVIVEKKVVQVYREDGTAENQEESFTKVLTEKGKTENRTLSLRFMLPYTTVEVVRLEVMKPKGEVIVVDVAANSKEAIDDSGMEMNIYDPNDRILQVNIPQLDIHDVVHTVVRQTTERSIIPGEFADIALFEGSYFIRHISYEVHAPEGKPLKQIALRDEVRGTVKYSSESGPEKTKIHRWKVDRVPRMFEEPSMPAPSTVLQRLLISTSPDWKSISQWYWNLSKPHLDAVTPELKKTSDRLVAQSKTDLEKVQALFYYVSKNIRYMGLTPEKDRPGFEPHDVCITFDKKYGVCRDKAALLVSLLRLQGLNAYPVLISVGAKMDPEVATPFFNHAIVGVELKKGEYLLMDPTNENTRELLPWYDCDQSYLICRPEGENLMVSSIHPAEENMMRVQTSAVLNASGTLEAKSALRFEGGNDNIYRQHFIQMKPDDRRHFFENNLKASCAGARLKSLQITPDNLLDVSVPLQVQLEFSVDDFMVSGNEKALISVPWIGKRLGLVNFILGGASLEKRKYILETQVACGITETISLQLSPDFEREISIPQGTSMEDPAMAYQQSFSFKERTVTCSREMKLKTVEFKPEQYAKLKASLKNLEYEARKSLVFAMVKKESPASSDKNPSKESVAIDSDVKISKMESELHVMSPHTAVYRIKYVKKILTYAGKKDESEVKINYNPSCEDVKIIRAAVISKEGKRQEISQGEINVMDQSWNASAKRYTGGKILVANLPGVEIGSTLEVEYEVAFKNSSAISSFEMFQLQDAIEQRSFKMTAPVDVKIETMLFNPGNRIQEEKKVSGNQQVFRWSAKQVPALPVESQLPPAWIYSPEVGYFVGDAKSYWSEMQGILLKCSQQSTKVAEQTRRLVAATSNPLEKIKIIRNYVAQSIRTAGPSFTDLPFSELSPADTTLTDGYGHSADQAILLHAMLVSAGFSPEFIMASDLPPLPEIEKVSGSFSLPGSFQVPLVKVEVDGESYYLNDTDQYAHLGTTAYDGMTGYSLSTQKIVPIHAAKNCQNRNSSDVVLSISDDGKTRVSVTTRYFGTRYNQQNRFFSELSPEELKRHYQEMVSSVAQGARPVSDLVKKFDVYPGSIQFSVEIDNFSVIEGKYLYFEIPFTPSLLTTKTDRRKLPLYFMRQSQSTIQTEIRLPNKFSKIVIAPKNTELTTPDHRGQTRITSSGTSSAYVINQQVEMNPDIVDPKDYPMILKMDSSLNKKSAKSFLLEAN